MRIERSRGFPGRARNTSLFGYNSGGAGGQVSDPAWPIYGTSEFYAPRTASITQSRGSGTPTETRATTATYRNNDGFRITALSGQLREQGARVVRNLTAGSSEALTNASWIKRGTCSVTTTGITPPTIAAIATRVSGLDTFGTSNDVYNYTGVALLSTSVIQPAFYLKRVSTSGVICYVNSVNDANGRWNIDLSALPDEWVRITRQSAYISVVAEFSAVASANNGVLIAKSSGTGTLTVDISATQFEDVTAQTTQTAGEYVSVGVLSAPYHGAGVDGVKYFNTDISGNPIPSATLDGALVEAAATNLCLQSQTFDNASWSKARSSVSADAAIAPDGTSTADKLVEDSTAANSHNTTQVVTTTAHQTQYLTASCYLKVGERTQCNITIQEGSPFTRYAIGIFTLSGSGTVVSTLLNGGAVGTASIEQCANGWYLCSVSALIGGAAANVLLTVGIVSGSSLTYNGDGTSGLYIWGAQVELGSYATEYIPTTTAAVTRNKDVLDDQVSGNLTAAAGTVAFQWTPTHDPSGTVALAGSYVDASNYTQVLHDATKYIFRKRIAGTNYDAELTAAFVSGTTYSIALKWGADGSQIAVDGTLGTANTTGIEGVQYGKLTGVAGTYFSTPDSAANSITGDIDIRVKAAATDWTGAADQRLVSTRSSGSGYELIIIGTTGTLGFYNSVCGLVVSTAAPVVSDGSSLWVRVTRNASTGDVMFYTSSDGSTWSQLGATVADTAGALTDDSTPLAIGMFGDGTTTPFTGNIYRAQIYNTIGGTTPVVDFNPADYTHGTTWTSSATGEVYTMNGNAAVWPAVKLGTRWQWGADGNGGQQAGAAFKEKYMWLRTLSDQELGDVA